MTDAHLMDADCVHGNPWYDCLDCWTDNELPGMWGRADFEGGQDEVRR